jgi:hypothetical protein
MMLEDGRFCKGIWDLGSGKFCIAFGVLPSLKLKKQVKRVQQTIPKTGVSVLPRCVCIDTYRILQLFYTCLRPSFFRNRSNLQPPFSVSN